MPRRTGMFSIPVAFALCSQKTPESKEVGRGWGAEGCKYEWADKHRRPRFPAL